jgi:hypothetical protein
MRPETFGRVLGIGLRVAGRVAGQRISAASQPASSSSTSQGAAASAPAQGFADGAQPARRPPTRQGGSLGRGLSGFIRPFTRVGGILWLEVTGVFFLLPVLVFAPTVWRTRMSYLHGPDHRTFVASVLVVVVFLYLGVTSFWRARKK